MANGGNYPPTPNPLVAQIQKNGSIMGGVGLAIGSIGQIAVAFVPSVDGKWFGACLGLQGLGTALMLIDARWHAKRGTDIAAESVARADIQRTAIAERVGASSIPPSNDPAVQRAAAKIATTPDMPATITAAAVRAANGRTAKE